MATLKKQFQKELKTNPKKAAVLGLLALVAIYFWFPLAMKMVSGGKSKNANKAAVVDSSASATATPEVSQSDGSKSLTPQVTTTKSFSWDQLLQWMQKDPLTASCQELKNEHDPFKSVETTIEVPTALGPGRRSTEPAAETGPAVVRDLSPAALGLKLTSTIVGSGRSVAMIDDRAYALGQRVVAYDGATAMPFRLVDIQPERVILERDEARYTLKIEQAVGLPVSVEETEGL